MVKVNGGSNLNWCKTKYFRVCYII